jgi:UBA/TS-N domain
LGDEEVVGPRESSEHATLASVESIAEMGFDRMDVLVALFAAKRIEDLVVESIL